MFERKAPFAATSFKKEGGAIFRRLGRVHLFSVSSSCKKELTTYNLLEWTEIGEK